MRFVKSFVCAALMISSVSVFAESDSDFDKVWAESKETVEEVNLGSGSRYLVFNLMERADVKKGIKKLEKFGDVRNVAIKKVQKQGEEALTNRFIWKAYKMWGLGRPPELKATLTIDDTIQLKDNPQDAPMRHKIEVGEPVQVVDSNYDF